MQTKLSEKENFHNFRLHQNKEAMLTEEKFVELARKQYHQIHQLQQVNSFYEYEKAFINIWNEFGRQTIQESISSTTKDRRTKKKS